MKDKQTVRLYNLRSLLARAMPSFLFFQHLIILSAANSSHSVAAYAQHYVILVIAFDLSHYISLYKRVVRFAIRTALKRFNGEDFARYFVVCQ